MPAVSDNPFVIFFFAFIPSALLVCGLALLTGTGVSKSRVESPALMLTNVAQSSTHIRTALGVPTSSRPVSGEHGSAFEVAMGETDVSLTLAVSRLAEDDPVDEAETVEPAQATSQEGTITRLGQTLKAESEPPIVERTEATPQLAEAEAPVAQRITHAHQPPESVPTLLGEPQSQPVALALTTKPTASSAKPFARSATASAYKATVWAALAAHKPRAVQRGSTTVTFELGASGALGSVRVRQSSGNAGLDQMALQTVRDAAPFAPPPNGASAYTIRIDFQ